MNAKVTKLSNEMPEPKQDSNAEFYFKNISQVLRGEKLRLEFPDKKDRTTFYGHIKGRINAGYGMKICGKDGCLFMEKAYNDKPGAVNTVEELVVDINKREAEALAAKRRGAEKGRAIYLAGKGQKPGTPPPGPAAKGYSKKYPLLLDSKQFSKLTGIPLGSITYSVSTGAIPGEIMANFNTHHRFIYLKVLEWVNNGCPKGTPRKNIIAAENAKAATDPAAGAAEAPAVPPEAQTEK